MKRAFHLLLLLVGAPAIAAEPLVLRPPDTTSVRDAPSGDDPYDTVRVSRPEEIEWCNVYRNAGNGRTSFLLGGETIGPGVSGARIGIAFVVARWFSLYLATAATVRGRDDGVTRVSLNTALAALLGATMASSRLASGYHGIDGLFYTVWAFGCCHGLLNPAIHIPVMKDRLVVTVRQATDVYIIGGVARGHSETSLGLQMLFGSCVAEVSVVKPWTRTIMNDPSVYLSAGLYVGFCL